MRRVLTVVAAAVLLALTGAVAALVLPVLWGEPSRIIIVSGHSMDPTFHTGDLIVVWPHDRYRTGDVAPYRVPEGEPGAGGLVIHRVVGGDGQDGYVMQGDNNDTPDIWMPTDDDVIGAKVLLVPRVGELLAWVRQPGVVAAVAAGLVTTMLLLPGKRRTDDPDEAADATTIDLRDDSADDTADGPVDGPTVIDLREPAHRR